MLTLLMRKIKRMAEKVLTQMELTDCLQKTLFKDMGLSKGAVVLLKCLVQHIYKDTSNGYYCKPSRTLLSEETGYDVKNFSGFTKELEAGGWVKCDSGSKGHSNTYYINAEKIVEAHNKWRASFQAREKSTNEFVTVTKDKIEKFKQVVAKKANHQRNMSGLMQNQAYNLVDEECEDEPF